MPNIKSQKKRDQLNKMLNERNRAERSFLRSTLKKFDVAAASNDPVLVASARKAAIKAIDRAAQKGLIHKNNAAHKKSRIDKTAVK
ncbi:MAG: 30S ribosomal protein S20 [Oscillospiraceae bacterium]|jgi:small subunit ribosomal protein S20|nr:30S ribosomal protein S20 [Oscillospiraceae bacterium]